MPRGEQGARVQDVRRRLRRWRLPALLVTNAADIHYLTGFRGDDSWALVLRDRPRVHILSDSRFEEEIAKAAPDAAVHLRRKGLAEELGRVAGRLRLRGLALPRDHVTLGQRRALGKHLRGVDLKPVAEGLLEQRAVKSAAEIALIRGALRIQQQAFRELLRELRPGRTENEVAAELEYRMRSLGADGSSFPTIVAADANASLPHAMPGRRRLKRGGIVLIDWGARYRGYCSDLTRVVALGKMPARIRDIYRVVLEAQLAGIAAIAPGRSLRDVDRAARGVIERAGLGKRFGHGLGHGIGLDIHEQPTLSQRAEGMLRPGHVVTVEPGVYLPGVGGVRIEDDVLVTDRGGRVLSDLPKDLDAVVV